MPKSTLTLQIKDLPTESVIKFQSLLKHIIEHGGSVAIEGPKSDIKDRLIGTIEAHQQDIPEGLRDLFTQCVYSNTRWDRDPILHFFNTFKLTNIDEVMQVFLEKEKLEKVKNTKWIGPQSIVKIMLALMQFEEYHNCSFKDDGKELSDIFPRIKNLPSRDDLESKWTNAFEARLRIWRAQTHEKIIDIYYALFMRWVQIKNMRTGKN